MYYTSSDLRTYGCPTVYEGFGQDWVGAIATGIAAAAQVGATIYTTNLQNKLAVKTYRDQRAQANAEKERQAAIAANIATAGGTASETEKPAGTIMKAESVIPGLDTSKLMLYGGIGVAALALIFILKR